VTTAAAPQAIPLDTLFLRALLLEGEPVRHSWVGWLSAATRDGTTARRALAPFNEFLPLLAWNLRRNGVALDTALQTHLRSALLTEELRWNKYRDICAQAFTLLEQAGLPFIALKGSVVGALVYPSPVFRHADDIDVLMDERHLAQADGLFIRAGWQRRASPALANPKHLPPLVHREGVPIELHWRLLVPYYTLPYPRLWERSQVSKIDDIDVRVLSAEDALILAVAHGVTEVVGLRWLADAWFMLERAGAFDWSRLLETVAIARLELPIAQGLRRLVEDLGAPVPPELLATLESRAARVGRTGRSAAQLWRPGLLLPPPVQFALHYDVPLWLVPFYYMYRLARGARMHLAKGDD
jgi:hypothetical protein